MDNWRPLSLLNVDYKIATKAIARRLEKVLPEIINEDQTGYVKGRFIGENIRLINDVMFHTLKANKPGIAIFLDFRKAFDTIEWEFLFKALKTFNFGSDFISWVQTFYGVVQSCVINNGHSSQMFSIERGVRQGCPLSCLLFVLCIEILPQSVKQDSEVLGIQVKGKEIEIFQYTDDTTRFVRNKTSIDKLLMILDNFGKCSGLKINTLKTKAMWLGSLRRNKSKPFGFKWPEESIVALGVSFSYNVDLTTQRNFEDKVTKLEKQLNLWRQRDLTLIGRITITKTLALAKLLYCASVLPVPKNIVQKSII